MEVVADGLASQFHGGTIGQKNIVWLECWLVLGHLYESASCEVDDAPVSYEVLGNFI